MTRLTQLGLGASDASRFTASFWFRLPTEERDYIIGTVPGQIPIKFIRPFEFQAFGGNIDLQLHYGHINPLPPFWQWYFQCVDETSFNSGESWGIQLPESSILGDEWYHFFIAVLTEGDHYNQRCFMNLNRVSVTEQFSPPSAGETPPLGVWNVWCNFDICSSFANVGTVENPYSNWQSHVDDQRDGYAHPFGINFSGADVNVPFHSTNPNIVNPEMEFAYFQMWLDTYIEPTAENLSKFIVEQDGKLYPVGGRVAADAFGVPDIWFERDNVSGIKFEENQGTAGPFEVVGTAPVDFNPDPNDDPPDVPT